MQPNFSNFSSPFTSPSTLNNLSTSFLNAKKFSFTGFLDGASKTLNTINQVIPLYTQVKPIVANLKNSLVNFKKIPKKEEITPLTNQNTLSNSSEIKKEAPSQNITFNNLSPSNPFFIK